MKSSPHLYSLNMANKSLVFLALCLAIAVSQSGAARNNNYNNNNNNNNNNNDDDNYNGNQRVGYSNNNNNNNNNRNYDNDGNNTKGGSSNGVLKTCKPLASKNVGVTCQCHNQNGDVVSCTERIAHGTKAMCNCKKNFVVRDLESVSEMNCQYGVWSRDINTYKCAKEPIAVGYNYIVGVGFYKLYKVHKKWEEAKEVCENDGGHLLVIDSAEEMVAAMASIPTKVQLISGGSKGKNTTTRVRSGGPYIGLSTSLTDDTMVAVTNAQVTTSLCDVPTGVTRKRSGRLCAALRPGSRCYVEISCTNKRSFICEIELPKANNASKTTTTRA